MKVLFLWVFFSLGLAQSQTPAADFSAEVFALANQLRCPVCQGESAGESNASIALEMRRIIAEQLAAGKTPAQVRQFFVDRYGDWILYAPPRRGLNLWVWLSPIIGLGLLGLALYNYQNRIRKHSVSEEDLARLESELKGRD
jgi:cytochrome c-type biogenesis protein CcmH